MHSCLNLDFMIYIFGHRFLCFSSVFEVLVLKFYQIQRFCTNRICFGERLVWRWSLFLDFCRCVFTKGSPLVKTMHMPTSTPYESLISVENNPDYQNFKKTNVFPCSPRKNARLYRRRILMRTKKIWVLRHYRQKKTDIFFRNCKTPSL